MRITRRIINQCSLVKVEHKQSTWQYEDYYDFYYYHKKVCSAFFNSEHNQTITAICEPWSSVRNAKNEMFLTRINRIEDEIHGVDVIDAEYIQALYMEHKATEQARAAHLSDEHKQMTDPRLNQFTANEFAKMYQQNIEDLMNKWKIISPTKISPKVYSQSVKITTVK